MRPPHREEPGRLERRPMPMLFIHRIASEHRPDSGQAWPDGLPMTDDAPRAHSIGQTEPMIANPRLAVLRYAAFTEDPRGGNPAGVVLDALGVDDATMLGTAARVGYSETAFVVARDSSRVSSTSGTSAPKPRCRFAGTRQSQLPWPGQSGTGLACCTCIPRRASSRSRRPTRRAV